MKLQTARHTHMRDVARKCRAESAARSRRSGRAMPRTPPPRLPSAVGEVAEIEGCCVPRNRPTRRRPTLKYAASRHKVPRPSGLVNISAGLAAPPTYAAARYGPPTLLGRLRGADARSRSQGGLAAGHAYHERATGARPPAASSFSGLFCRSLAKPGFRAALATARLKIRFHVFTMMLLFLEHARRQLMALFAARHYARKDYFRHIIFTGMGSQPAPRAQRSHCRRRDHRDIVGPIVSSHESSLQHAISLLSRPPALPQHARAAQQPSPPPRASAVIVRARHAASPPPQEESRRCEKTAAMPLITLLATLPGLY